jgi:hypothetical protein
MSIKSDQIKLDDLHYHISRFDLAREQTTLRASIVVSGDIALLGSFTVLAAERLGSLVSTNTLFAVLVTILSVLMYTVLLYSAFLALNAFASINKKHTRDLYGYIPDRIPYAHSDVKKRFTSSAEFRDHMLKSSTKDQVESAVAELYTVISQYNTRYKKFVRSARYLTVGFAFFVIVTTLVLVV